MIKKTIYIIYIIILITLAVATIVEKYHGTSFVISHIYSSWWICILWALLTATGFFYLLKKKVKRLSVITLHLSFIIILFGALLTHLTAKNGIVHIRLEEKTNKYTYNDSEGNVIEKELPFFIKLNNFEVQRHEGTNAASDYISHITIITKSDNIDAIVSMNNIYSHNNTRIYQSSFDDDEQGSYLSITSDPFGIPITYVGYALLFIGLIWILIDPRGSYRRLLRDPLIKKGVLTIVLFVSSFTLSNATEVPVLSQEMAKTFCKINVLYNDRICPLQTYALDFTKKIYGKRSYNGYSAEQVFTGFLFWRESWMKERIIRIKDAIVRDKLQLPEYCSGDMLIVKGQGYVLGPYLNEFMRGNNDKFHEGINKLDEKLGLIMELHNKEPLKIFPYTYNNITTWYGPNDQYPDYIEPERKEYMQTIMEYFDDEAHNNKMEEMNDAITKLQKYQYTFGGKSIPSEIQLKSEYIYNSIPIPTILFMLNLTMGFLCLFYSIYLLTRESVEEYSGHSSKHILSTQIGIMTLSFLALSFCLVLRWIIKGTVPLSNGYETMLVMAWIIMLVSLIICKKFHIILTFGFLLSGFFLLVSHISQMDPQITHLMPVLESPLLTIHVSIIMIAYALLALTFICGIMAIILRLIRGKHAERLDEQLKSLQVLSRLFLYPSITAMGFGIFIGAIWANVSWGTYWSWDPKETWALITLMVYAIAVHTNSIPSLRKPMNYHIFMTLSFLSILMTYFGVNYFLGGMHSYA